jgi:hypothetical protein
VYLKSRCLLDLKLLLLMLREVVQVVPVALVVLVGEVVQVVLVVLVGEDMMYHVGVVLMFVDEPC